MDKPSIKPDNPNFSSGPCSKRPGWSLDALKDTPIGRSHRAKECKDKLNEVIVKSKKILGLPENYHLRISYYCGIGDRSSRPGVALRTNPSGAGSR